MCGEVHSFPSWDILCHVMAMEFVPGLTWEIGRCKKSIPCDTKIVFVYQLSSYERAARTNLRVTPLYDLWHHSHGLVAALADSSVSLC